MIRLFKSIAILLLIVGCEPEENLPTQDEDFSDYQKIKEIRATSSLSGLPFETSVHKYEYREDKSYQLTYTIDSTYGSVYQFEYNNQNQITTIYRPTSEEINSETGQPIQAGMDISGSDSLFNITRHTYEDNNLVKISTEDNRNTLIFHVGNEDGRIVSVELETIPYNSDVIFDDIRYKYNSNENIHEIHRENEDGVAVAEYQYDENPNPFHAYYENFGFLNVRAEGVRVGLLLISLQII